MPKKKKVEDTFRDLDYGYKVRIHPFPDGGNSVHLIDPEGEEIECSFGYGVKDEYMEELIREFAFAALLHMDRALPYDRPPHRGVGGLRGALYKRAREPYVEQLGPDMYWDDFSQSWSKVH